MLDGLLDFAGRFLHFFPFRLREFMSFSPAALFFFVEIVFQYQTASGFPVSLSAAKTVQHIIRCTVDTERSGSGLLASNCEDSSNGLAALQPQQHQQQQEQQSLKAVHFIMSAALLSWGCASGGVWMEVKTEGGIGNKAPCSQDSDALIIIVLSKQSRI